MKEDGHFRHRVAAMLFSIQVTLSVFVLVQTFAPRSAAQLNWVVEVLDSGPYVGEGSSLALDSKGWPHTSYEGGRVARYAHWNGANWSIETVSPWSYCAMDGTSLAIDSHDRPWIAYAYTYDVSCQNYNVEIAHWNGTGWETLYVDPPGVNAGYYPSLVLDSKDRLHIVYHNETHTFGGNHLKLVYAVLNGSSWDRETIFVTNFTNDAGPGYISLKLDSQERPRVAYSDSNGLKFIHLEGSEWLVDVIDIPSLGPTVSLALDSKDLPHISYYNGYWQDINYTHWDGTAWIIETAVSFGNVGLGASIALDSNDSPHISYGHGSSFGPPGYYLFYTQKSAGPWVDETADPTDGVSDTSLALDSFDLPHISYMRRFNLTHSELRYAHAPIELNDIPVSHVLPIHPYWNGNPVEANATDYSGVANVTLMYTYSNDNSSWMFWLDYVKDASPPWSWDFTYPDGEGYYQFHSFAEDVMGNVEPLRGTADAIAGYDITPPISRALPVSPYWHTSPLIAVDATATDNLSGVADVTLLYSHAPLDNSSWSAWTVFGTRTSPPWSWSFPFPDGKGNYRFHTIASDVAGNVEGAKTVAEAVAGYNGTAPVTMPDYSPINEQPVPPVRVGLSSPVYLSLAVHNGGNATATTDTILAFYNSTAPATPFRTFIVNPIAPDGNSSRFTASWTSPATPGTCLVSANVDYWNNVTEWSEGDNVYTWTIDVVIGPITSLVIGYPNYTSPTTATFVKSTTSLSFSVLDQSGLGIRNTTYTIDGGNPVNHTATGTFFLVGEGLHKMEWRSLDWAGNLEQVDSMNLTVDDTPPATTIHQSEEQATTATVFALTATDPRCGVNVTMYRIDGGSWTTYFGGFTLTEGEHNISYYSNDMLNNTEEEKWLVVTVEGTTTPPPQPPEVAVNYKPTVALVFTVILAVAGFWSSRKRPWKGEKERMAVVKAFAVVSMPFVLAEAATGVLSFFTGQLSIPPLVGAGTAVDLAILLVGLVVAILRIVKIKPLRVGETSTPQKR